MVSSLQMFSMKTAIRWLVFLAILFGAGWLIMHLHHLQYGSHRASAAAELQPTFQFEQVPHDSYDYERMLTLLAKLKEVKTAFHAKFAEEKTDALVPSLDAKELRELLADFYREKNRFARYLLSVRYHYKGHVPRKRARCLRNHEHILEHAAKTLERMLRAL